MRGESDTPPEEWPPVLLPGADEYLRAFNDLAGERQLGGQIAYSAIDRWAARHGFSDPEDFEELVTALAILANEVEAAGREPKGRLLSPELFDAVF